MIGTDPGDVANYFTLARIRGSPHFTTVTLK
jgi:hypothetical protein